jgi:phage antirepressor YoqD-like protein
VAQRKLEERTAQLDAANKRIEKLEPKAAYFDTVASADGSTSFRETAKLFKVGEKTFTKFIEESNLCYRDSHKRLIPYAERQKSGWFEVKEVTITTSTGIKTTIYTKITPKGRTEIFKRLQTAGILNPHGMEGTV